MSETYRALTRKYRPRTFEDIVSQEHVSSTLRNAIDQNRLSHAYLFTGPRGVGKTTMARVLARLVNGVSEDVDGEDLSSTLDISEIDAASNNSVDDVRLLREWVRVPPQVGTYKVYIIDEVHMLSKQAFNALLKTLEEPPKYILFIFATTEPHKLLPTVLSRCQRFDFRRIKVSEIVDRLRFICKEENIQIDDESLHVIAQRADGALRDALSIMDQAIAFCGEKITYSELMTALNIVSNENLFKITDAIQNKDVNAGLALIDHLLMIGHDMQELLIALTTHLRNMYLAKDTGNLYLVEATEETKNKIKAAASDFSTDDIMRMLHLVSEAQYKIRLSQQPRIQLEITLLKLLTMERSEGLQQLLMELKELKKSGGISTSEASDKPAEASVKSVSQPDSKSGSPSPPKVITETQRTALKVVDEALDEKDEDKPAEQPKPVAQPVAENLIKKPSLPASPVQATPRQESPPASGSDLFGAPAIHRPSNNLTAINLDDSATQQSVGLVEGNLALDVLPDSVGDIIVQYQDVKDHWNAYLNHIRQDVSTNLYFAMARTRPYDIKNEMLIIECQDHLTENIIKENRRDLAACWRPLFGKPLVIETRINLENAQKEPDDPFTRFKELQKKEPVIRTIVELFGAELEF